MLAYTNKYWNVFIPFIKRGLIKRYGKKRTKKIVKRADIMYRDLLRRADDIGKDNPMASNMYEVLIFFAIWDATNRKMTVDDLRNLTDEIMSMPILKLTGLFLNFNRPSCIKLFSKMMKRNVKWLDEHPQYKDVSWDFNFDRTKNKKGLYYHFTQCPINTFARREGYLEILPVMCDIDFKTASLMHANLHRQSTLAKGGDICDYWFIGDRIEHN